MTNVYSIKKRSKARNLGKVEDLGPGARTDVEK